MVFFLLMLASCMNNFEVKVKGYEEELKKIMMQNIDFNKMAREFIQMGLECSQEDKIYINSGSQPKGIDFIRDREGNIVRFRLILEEEAVDI